MYTFVDSFLFSQRVFSSMEEKILFNLDKRSVELTIEIPYEMFEKMKEIKEAYGLSYAEFVRNAIAEKLVKSQV